MNSSASHVSTELRETTNVDRSRLATTQAFSQALSTSPNESFRPAPTRTNSLPPRTPSAAHSETNEPSAKSRFVSAPDSKPADELSCRDRSAAPSEIRPAILHIAEHPQAELLSMLSALLTRITTTNDKLHTAIDVPNPSVHGTPLLAFHARNVPLISIHSYLTRILKYCPMSSDIFLSLLVYFDRMSKGPLTHGADDKDTFTSTRQYLGTEHHPFSIDSFNIHRLVITGIVVASKFCSDVFYTNSRYAKVSHVLHTDCKVSRQLTVLQVGGLPLSELNHLEFQFLLLNDFRLMIPMEELQRYGNQLLTFWQNEQAM